MVTLTMIAVLSGLAILTLWGAVAPRGQWRVLAGWSRSRPYASEPGPVAVGIHRFVAIAASIALVVTAASYYLQRHDLTSAVAATPKTALDVMWDDANPEVVNRVIQPYETTPYGLKNQPILRYQPVDGIDRLPSYLFALPIWNPPTIRDGDGYIGVSPDAGSTALDGSSIVVQVRADAACIPRAVVATETDKSVSIGVYYGRPSPEIGAPKVPISKCATDLPVTDGSTVLIPVPLDNKVGTRSVTTLKGDAIPLTKDVTSG
ncbi:hypothetical protein [Lacisediminihabitans changchengi]|uniref:DUF6199 domain-containing protein n=1 Tax=Lacisediminihabitans changchengi TaxID=2787634 RepID=A0A934W1V9_9MICO|nr:hypothetical protein [Lacisediminihabitans changchengi]MBK4347283.1 hypothetical protein [Lacisediminihabitans changchengi]